MDTKERWLGLRSYNESDASIFYGRSAEINKICNAISYNDFTIIYGPSGIGKTSIIKAGVFPKMIATNYFPVYIRFDHSNSLSYAEQVCNGIVLAAHDRNISIVQTRDYIKKDYGSIWEYLHCNEFWDCNDYPAIPLIVIDQFEELFTLGVYNENGVESFFEELLCLCNDKYPDYVRDVIEHQHILYPRNIQLRVVLSIREDFLARIEKYAEDIPSLRHNRISIQILNEEQAMEIIMSTGNDILTHDIAIQIIQKVTNKKNFSIDGKPEIDVEPSILSLFCNELDNKRQAIGAQCITSDMLNDFGENIISDFYRVVMQSVSNKCVEIIENRLLTTDGYRESMSINDLKHDGVTDAEINHLISNRIVRIEERERVQRLEFSHDVLCKIATDHRNLRREKSKIESERIKYENLRRKSIRIYTATGLVLATIIILILGYCHRHIWEYKEYYSEFVWQHEYPIGINKLSKSALRHSAKYIEFAKKGSKAKHWTSFRYMDNLGRVLPTPGSTFLIDIDNSEDDAVNQTLAERLQRCSKYVIISDAEDKQVNQLRVYDDSDRLIYCYSINRHHFEDGQLKYTMGQYTDSEGFPIESRQNGAQIIRISYDDAGFRESIEYFDVWGNKATSYNNSYGQKFLHSCHPDSLGLLLQTYNIGKNDEPVPDSRGIYGTRYTYKQSNGHWQRTEIHNIDSDGNSILRECRSYDKYGNIIETSFFDKDGPIMVAEIESKKTYHLAINSYDTRGNITSIRYFDSAHLVPSSGIARIERRFSDENKLTAEIAYDSHDNPIPGLCFSMEYHETEDISVIRRINLSSSLEPEDDTSGICIYERKEDRSGRLLHKAFYNQEHKQIGAIESFCYSDDLVIEYRRTPPSGEAADPDHYNLIRFSYDSKGRRIRTEYFDHLDSIIPEVIALKIYDRQGNLIEERSTDANGVSLPNSVITKYTYDVFGKVTSISQFCHDNNTPAETDGIHKRFIEYDENGTLIKITFYNKKSEIIAEQIL